MKKFYCLCFLFILLAGCGGRNTSKQVQEEPPYGDWEIGNYVNDFDEPTGEKFVRQIIRGDFSNSASVKPVKSLFISIQADLFIRRGLC